MRAASYPVQIRPPVSAARTRKSTTAICIGGTHSKSDTSAFAMIPAFFYSYIEGLKTHDVEMIADTVADELRFVTATTTLNKQQFLAMLRALYAGFPDWHYDHDAPEVRDALIAVRWRQSGTHLGILALPGMTPSPPPALESPFQSSISTTGWTIFGSLKSVPSQYLVARPAESCNRSVFTCRHFESPPLIVPQPRKGSARA